jgi:transposase
MALYVRTLSGEELRQLESLQHSIHDLELARRAQIVLLSARKRGVYEISRVVGLHPINVRKWLHRFGVYGVKGLSQKRSPGRPRVFTSTQRQAIVSLATADPQDIGLECAGWSLQRLRQFLIGQGVVEEISAETIRQELIRAGLVFEGRHWTRTI